MLLSAREAYRLWAETYDTNPNPLLALESRLLRTLIADEPGQFLCDVACGTGREMVSFSLGGTVVFGVDCSAEMLRVAARQPLLKSRLVLADAVALPLRSGISDITLCSFAANYFSDLDAALFEIARITKPSGKVIVTDFHPDAVARGWSRSFRVGEQRYEISHAAYSEGEIQNARRRAGLYTALRSDASLSEQERPIFMAAGREGLYEQACRNPAIRIEVWCKQ